MAVPTTNDDPSVPSYPFILPADGQFSDTERLQLNEWMISLYGITTARNIQILCSCESIYPPTIPDTQLPYARTNGHTGCFRQPIQYQWTAHLMDVSEGRAVLSTAVTSMTDLQVADEQALVSTDSGAPWVSEESLLANQRECHRVLFNVVKAMVEAQEAQERT